MSNASVSGKISSKKWRVVYTRSNWEKRSDQLLKRNGLDSFCPLVKTQRKWSDRRKTVEIPLFSSYLFVHVSPLEEDKVLQVDGIVGYVRDFGKNAEISSEEIQKIENLVNAYEDIECINTRELKKGDQVYVDDGILFDLHGEICEVRGKQVVLLVKGLDCGLIAKVKIESNAHLLTQKRYKL